MKPDVLIISELPPWGPDGLKESFAVHHEPNPAGWDGLIDKVGPERIRVVMTNGSVGLTAAMMARLPNLELICSSGAGYENVDLAAAKARGIPVTNGPSTNDVSVADHAFALMLGIARGIAESDVAVKRGDWGRAARPAEWQGIRRPRTMVSGRRLGILGLGTIGKRIATRAAAGFEMQVSYHNRKPNPELPYRYVDSAIDLARDADFLMVACPGGAATRHLVGTAMLDALGPEGFLVNISRGSVVDSAALAEALRRGAIAGAALDVVEGEPQVPDSLLSAPNLIISPHLGGRSVEAVRAFMALVKQNLEAHFAGRPLLSRVA